MTAITTDQKNTTINKSQLLQSAKQVINLEQQAISGLLDSINDDFIKACELLINCQARIIVTGIGKSGHIGNKIAASFASLGSPAFFLHAAEAQHGDIGMITNNDVIIALSYSGSSNELLSLIPSLKYLKTPIISITGNSESELAKSSTVHLPINITQEACHLNLAPTCSTTATLVLGDALAVAVTKAKAFTSEDFARSHPGGNLGRRLVLKTSDIMATGDNLATVNPDTNLTEALFTMTSKRLGMLAITDNSNSILGIFTDGDLRRLFNKLKTEPKQLSDIQIQDIMNTNYTKLDQDTLAVSAWELICDKKINGLLITEPNSNKLIGMINTHTLIEAKII